MFERLAMPLKGQPPGVELFKLHNEIFPTTRQLEWKNVRPSSSLSTELVSPWVQIRAQSLRALSRRRTSMGNRTWNSSDTKLESKLLKIQDAELFRFTGTWAIQQYRHNIGYTNAIHVLRCSFQHTFDFYINQTQPFDRLKVTKNPCLETQR